MYSKQLFCLAILVTLVIAEIPPYITICGKRNPKIDECILNSVTALNSKIREGMPEFDVPPIDPIVIDKVLLSNTPTLRVEASDIKLWGLADYEAKNFHIDFEKQEIDTELHFDEERIEAKYDANVRILVPIAGHGRVQIISKNITSKSKMMFKLVDRGGEKYAFFYAMKTQLYVGDYTSKFISEGTSNKVLEEAINAALGGTQREILDFVTPNIEKAISQKVLEMTNKVCKHMTFAEIFPDRE